MIVRAFRGWFKGRWGGAGGSGLGMVVVEGGGAGVVLWGAYFVLMIRMGLREMEVLI